MENIYRIVNSMFVIIPVIMFGVIAFAIISAIKKNRYNNAQSVLTVDAKVVSKRTKSQGERTRTYYYVTFELGSGERSELNMKGNEFGMLVEGDNGQLTFQGNRYLGFKRI